MKTPGGNLRYLHIKKRGTPVKCGDCGIKLPGVSNTNPGRLSAFWSEIVVVCVCAAWEGWDGIWKEMVGDCARWGTIPGELEQVVEMKDGEVDMGGTTDADAHTRMTSDRMPGHITEGRR